MDVMTVKSRDYAVGQTNMGGTQGKAYYVPAMHVKTWTPPTGESMTMATAPVLKSGKQWSEVYFTKDSGAITDKEVGDFDCGSWETELEFWSPKIDEELLQLKAIFSNGPFIFVMEDGNGVRRVVGSPKLGAYRDPGDVTTGKASKDKNGATFKFKASSPKPAYICNFDISLTPAV